MKEDSSKAGRRRRFEFGRNWSEYLQNLGEFQMKRAEESLKSMLGVDELKGRTFLDIGSGSGLFSLAARRLGAKVHSFDYDPDSVECTAELKRRFFEDDADWVVERGSILDSDYLASLGLFDVVYSWGVLHHTGDIWKSARNAASLAKPGGLVFVAIYNDQGRSSRIWRHVKRIYVYTPGPFKWAILIPSLIRLWGTVTFKDLVKYGTLKTWKQYSFDRGMSPWHDLIDWVGGYPFEVAKPEQVINFMDSLGLLFVLAKTCGEGRGCNEFVFKKRTAPAKYKEPLDGNDKL
jgi:2-polyprenyl-6-hydroxyphenyl methylase/3-demethylubiquinone-9 3-methyltransferase